MYVAFLSRIRERKAVSEPVIGDQWLNISVWVLIYITKASYFPAINR